MAGDERPFANPWPHPHDGMRSTNSHTGNVVMEPGDHLVGERAVEGKRFVEETESILMVGADGVAILKIKVDVGRLGLMAPAQDQGPVAGNFRNLLGGGSAGSDERNGGE